VVKPASLPLPRTTLNLVILSEVVRAFANDAVEGPAVAVVLAFLSVIPEGDLPSLALLLSFRSGAKESASVVAAACSSPDT
jgi:hypothetical protein